MKILHTSDWHLGKRLFKLDRSQEHDLFLDWLIETIKKEEVDLLLIAGDIFDSPTPPHQSLETYYNFLHRLSEETKTHTFIIAGNHDGGLLLDAPSKILSHHRVKVWGKLSKDPADHWIRIQNIDVCALPFFRSYEILPEGSADAIDALKKYLFFKEKERPQVLLLHHLAGIHEAAGSEQVISLSGVDSIPAELLSKFDYVALGHIHKPQKIASHSYYSGSPIPMRFSETLRKSVVIIERKEDALVPFIKEIPVFRDILNLKTTEEKIFHDLQELKASSLLRPMVEVQIELTSPRVGLIDEIKSILEKKEMELLSFRPIYESGESGTKKTQRLFELSPLEIFKDFYAAKYPEAKDVPEDLIEDFKILLEKVKNAPHTS
jgi:DNA repair protein SbcD/Mre11